MFVFCDVVEEMSALVDSNNLASTGALGSTSASRPTLKKSLSINQIALPNSQKYLELTRVQLRTADNLAPLPMSMGWVREGLLVVGMDNEMHCYTQWTDVSSDSAQSKLLNILQLKPPANNVSPACALLYDESKGELMSLGIFYLMQLEM